MLMQIPCVIFDFINNLVYNLTFRLCLLLFIYYLLNTVAKNKFEMCINHVQKLSVLIRTYVSDYA